MDINRYQELDSPSAADVDQALAADDPDCLKLLLVGAALHWIDRASIEALCSRLSCHSHEEVRGNAILGFGHIARRFGDLSKCFDKVIELGLIDSSQYVRGQAWAAADDVNHFLGWNIPLDFEQGSRFS